MFSVTCFAADYSVEKKPEVKEYTVTYYETKTTVDGKTVQVEGRTEEYTIARIDELISRAEDRKTDIQEDIDKYQAIKVKMTAEDKLNEQL